MMLAVPLLVRDWRIGSFIMTRRPELQMVRSLCVLVSALCFYTGLKYLPLAEVVAIIFIGPLLVTMLSAWLLGETVGLRRWVACVVGFAGALIVVRPGLGGLGWAALFPITSTVLYAFYAICTRKVAPSERNGTMMFYAAVASVAFLGLTSPGYWVALSGVEWLGLITVGVVSCTSTALSIRAFSLAPASLLAPFAYVEIVTATTFGVVVFADLPDVFTVVGAAVIVGSGLYVFHAESSLAPQQA